jgi:hypothetical protein
MSKKDLMLFVIACIVLSGSLPTAGAESETDLYPIVLATNSGNPLYRPFVVADQSVDTISPAVAYNSIFDYYLVVWNNDRPGYDDIYAQLLSADGRLLNNWHPVAAGTGAERRNPDVAYNPNWNEFLVVWEQIDEATGRMSIRGQRLDFSGVPTGNEIPIGTPTTNLGTANYPHVEHSFTSGKYMVVWQNHTQGNLSNDILGELVINDGTLDGSNFIIALGTTGFSMGIPDLAYNRRMNEFLVVWDQLDKNASLNDVYARIVRPDKSMPPTTIEIARYTVSSTNPTVAALPLAATDGQYLVAWELQYAANDKDILGRLINGDGSLAPSAFDIARSGLDETDPAAAGNEHLGEYLLTWTRPTAPPIVFNGIWSRAFSTTGVQAGSEKWTGGVLAENSALVSGAGGEYLVVFDDLTLSANRDIYGRLWGNRYFMPLIRH